MALGALPGAPGDFLLACCSPCPGATFALGSELPMGPVLLPPTLGEAVPNWGFRIPPCTVNRKMHMDIQHVIIG